MTQDTETEIIKHTETQTRIQGSLDKQGYWRECVLQRPWSLCATFDIVVTWRGQAETWKSCSFRGWLAQCIHQVCSQMKVYLYKSSAQWTITKHPLFKLLIAKQSSPPYLRLQLSVNWSSEVSFHFPNTKNYSPSSPNQTLASSFSLQLHGKK